MNSATFESWLTDVKTALRAINMPMEDWQKAWEFDFATEYHAGTDPARAAEKANRFWWREQNRALHQDCTIVEGCWLPRGHQGACEPIS
jgi:hypothetical protein